MRKLRFSKVEWLLEHECKSQECSSGLLTTSAPSFSLPLRTLLKPSHVIPDGLSFTLSTALRFSSSSLEVKGEAESCGFQKVLRALLRSQNPTSASEPLSSSQCLCGTFSWSLLALTEKSAVLLGSIGTVFGEASLIKKVRALPGQVAQLVQTSSHTRKGCEFEPPVRAPT